MRQPIAYDRETRAQLAALAGELKGDKTYFQLGILLGCDPSMMQRTVAYGRPPSASWLLYWRKNGATSEVRTWASETLIIMGLLDLCDYRD